MIASHTATLPASIDRLDHRAVDRTACRTHCTRYEPAHAALLARGVTVRAADRHSRMLTDLRTQLGQQLPSLGPHASPDGEGLRGLFHQHAKSVHGVACAAGGRPGTECRRRSIHHVITERPT